MSKIEVNQISSQCGSTLTIGQSGDSIQLACGASQTGFGRTGTVDWDTTAKTSAFTAVSGNGYFVNTTSGDITVTLPATPSAGDIVSVSDYNGTAGTNAITIARNSSNINGNASDYTIDASNSAVTFVYVDGTVGWTSVYTSNVSDTSTSYINATGGTVTCCGDYKIHTFTSPGTFNVSSISNIDANNEISYLVVAGGAGGGSSQYGCAGCGAAGGGGGGGGFRENKSGVDCYSASPLEGATNISVTSTAFPITVGGGGAGGPDGNDGSNGSNSVFSIITSAGGGGGGRDGPNRVGAAGGSGGGGGGERSGTCGGAGNTPPVSPPQGQPGGNGGGLAPSYGAGGGGGATVAGSQGNPTFPTGNGGAGATTSISASPTSYAGGGGGGNYANTGAPSGGTGGGGNGANGPTVEATPGTANTGGGGGGAGGGTYREGKAGGSGIVIIRYKYQ